MKYHLIAILSSILLFGVPHLAFAACDQTINVGANLASAISSAAPGTTICLNPGNYGRITIGSLSKASEVTVQSSSGTDASLSLNINGANRLKFQNLTISGLEILGSTTKNITISGSKFTGQALLRLDSNTNANILIDRNTFDNISVCANCFEGRLQVMGDAYPIGVTISNNHFGGPGESDGIQLGASGVVVGPGNVFDGIVQGNYGRHVDAIQGYGQSRTTITGNYFVNNSIQIMMPDGGRGETITNNVFVASAGNNGIQLGTHRDGVFEHNTVKNITVNLDKKVENSTPSQNAIARNNIMINSRFKTVDSGGNAACSNCAIDHNLFNSSNFASGTNNLIGNPAFVGGSVPTTWDGYKLTSSSLGYRSATDGNDMGSNFFGNSVEPVAPPSPPTDVQVN